MSKELDIGKECCDIWNKLKDKTKMIDYLIESKKQIADLEAKLAESEESCILLEGLRKSEAEKKDIAMKRVSELKQQLFESGLKTLEEIKLSEQRKKMLEDLSTKNWELEQQLAEKEKEIEIMKQTLVDREETIVFADKTIKGLNLNHNQDKILFAVEQLDKLKQLFIYNYNNEIECIDPYDNNCCLSLSTTLYNTTIDIFDNQIEELKKEMK